MQAEDGIRDLIVTGVQTCALPILQQNTILRYELFQFLKGQWSNLFGVKYDVLLPIFMRTSLGSLNSTSPKTGFSDTSSINFLQHPSSNFSGKLRSWQPRIIYSARLPPSTRAASKKHSEISPSRSEMLTSIVSEG